MGMGGIGAFAGGFAKGFQSSRESRRLRDALELREQMAADRERRLKEQFDTQMDFRKGQQESLNSYRQQQLEMQQETGRRTGKYQESQLELQKRGVTVQEKSEERQGTQFETEHDLRVKQADALKTYQEGQIKLQEKQVEIQRRQLDLNIYGGLEKAFDPKVPKAQRKFILKQTAKQLGLKPDSVEYKEFEQMAQGLDDEALKDTQSALKSILPGAPAGTIYGFAKSIISGQLLMKDALEQFGNLQIGQATKDILGGGGGGDAPEGGVPTTAVPTSRITNPTPMAQQQGGDLPIPGMEQPEQEGEILTGTPEQQVKKLREAAMKFAKLRMHEDARVQLEFARNIEDGQNIQLKEIVDENGVERYVKSSEAEGQPAPMRRPVRTPEEEQRVQDAKNISDLDMKQIIPIQEDAKSAGDMQAPLEAFKLAAESGKFETGAVGPLRANIARWADFFGVDPNQVEALKAAKIGDAKTADLMEGASAQIATMLADRLGRATNMQVGITQSAIPNLLRTPEGNELIIELAEKTNQRFLDINALKEKYIDTYGTFRPAQVKKEWKDVPSLFAKIDEMRRKPIIDQGYVDKVIKDSKAKVGKSTFMDLIDSARGEKLTFGEDSYDIEDYMELELDKKTYKLPILDLGGQQLPYAKALKEIEALPKGAQFLWFGPASKDSPKSTLHIRDRK